MPFISHEEVRSVCCLFLIDVHYSCVMNAAARGHSEVAPKSECMAAFTSPGTSEEGHPWMAAVMAGDTRSSLGQRPAVSTVQPWPSSPTCIPATAGVHHEKADLEGDGYGTHLGWARFGAGPCATQVIILRIEK